VVGTSVYSGTINKISHEVLNQIGIRVRVEEINHPDGRVVLFHIPSRPRGQLIKSKGKYTYPMRAGESLVEMDNQTMKSILNETDDDYSAKFVKDITIKDLDEGALKTLKHLWSQKSGRKDFLSFSHEKILKSLNLILNGKVTYAAVILLGKKDVIDAYLPNCEIIFEWRQDSKKIPYDYRTNWREPLLNIYDDLWEKVNTRNIRIPFQEGFVQKDIWAFDEKSIREAILNAITHRDYNEKSRSIFIKASPEEFRIESPGGFVYPVSPENILDISVWRNRRLAETLEKAGLVERSGQGMDDIFDKTIRDGKGVPDFPLTDKNTVILRIPAKVKDPKFILFLEKVAKEKNIVLSTQDLYELENVRVQQEVKNINQKFLDWGLVERIGIGRGTKYILSHSYYAYEGRPGLHTKLTGISRDEKKALIMKYFDKNKRGVLRDFCDIFPELTKKDVANLLQELRKDGRLNFFGKIRTGYWEKRTRD